MVEAISFFIALLPIIPPRKFRFKRATRKPIIVYTDAMYTKGASIPAAIGICIYDPYNEHKWQHASAEVPPWVMAKFESRDQYIGQLEVIAAVAAYSSKPAQFRERDVVHFIDNTGALVGIAKGQVGPLSPAQGSHTLYILVSLPDIAAVCACHLVGVWLDRSWSVGPVRPGLVAGPDTSGGSTAVR